MMGTMTTDPNRKGHCQPGKKAGRDNRKLERYSLNIPTRIRPRRPDDAESLFELCTCNVCAGGAFFSTVPPLPEGTQVSIEMLLPVDRLKLVETICGAVRVTISGRVLRSGQDGMAVKFDQNYKFHQSRSADGPSGLESSERMATA